MRHECKYLICLHFYIEDLTHIKHPQTGMREGQPGWRRLRNRCRESSSCWFYRNDYICRLILPLDVQDFHLAFLSRNFSMSRVLNQVLDGLILIPQWTWLRTGLQELKLAITRLLWGCGEVILDLNSFWGWWGAKFWVEVEMELPESPVININKRYEHT